MNFRSFTLIFGGLAFALLIGFLIETFYFRLLPMIFIILTILILLFSLHQFLRKKYYQQLIRHSPPGTFFSLFLAAIGSLYYFSNASPLISAWLIAFMTFSVFILIFLFSFFILSQDSFNDI